MSSPNTAPLFTFTILPAGKTGGAIPLKVNAFRNTKHADPAQIAEAFDDLEIDLRRIRVALATAITINGKIPGPTAFGLLDNGYGRLFLQGVAPNPPDGIQQMTFLAPSIDETDLGWWGTGTIDGATDPITFLPTFTNHSRFGRLLLKVKVGGGGSGYTIAQIVFSSATNPAAAAGIVAQASFNAGVITNITLISAGGWVPADLTVAITGNGSGATATLVLSDVVPGDYIIWNDPGHYEIDFVAAVDDATGNVTLNRHLVGDPAGNALFGSLVEAHNCAFFRLDMDLLSTSVRKNVPGSVVPTTDSGVQERYPYPFPSRTAVALIAVAACDLGFSTLTTMNLYQNFGALTGPICPGYRALDGNLYIYGIPGVLAVGSTGDSFRPRITAPANIRCVSGRLGTAPVGAALAAYIVYITPDALTVGLIDILTFPSGSQYSYNLADPPRRMPYHVGWTPTTAMSPADWPPSIMPQLTGALDVNGNLVTGWTLNPALPVFFQERGWLGVIVTQVGSPTTEGANLEILFET